MIELGLEAIPVTRLCELLDVARSTFYYRPEELSEEDTALLWSDTASKQDIAGVIIHDGGKIIPALIDHLEVGKVGLPELIDSRCGIFKLIFGGNHRIGGRCHQIIGFEDPVDAAF